MLYLAVFMFNEKMFRYTTNNRSNKSSFFYKFKNMIIGKYSIYIVFKVSIFTFLGAFKSVWLCLCKQKNKQNLIS